MNIRLIPKQIPDGTVAFMQRLLVALAAWGVAILLPTLAQAGSATWDTTPATGDWNTPGNWTPPTVPNASTDTATFAQSNTTSVSISAPTEVNGIVFNAAAAANPFTISVPDGLTLTISGVGITNNSGVTQSFGNFGTVTGAPNLSFTNSATAGSMTVITNNAATVSGKFGSITQFNDGSSAGSATIINQGGGVSGELLSASLIQFNGSSTAGSATITDNGATASGAGGAFTEFNTSSTAGSATIVNNAATGTGTFGGLVNFLNTSSAGSATIINNGSTLSADGTNGTTVFLDSSTAGAATLIANGGTGGGSGGRIDFDGNSDGGTARMEVFGNGKLDISGHNAPGVTIGSVEGSGNVFLGANNLAVGSNNQNTVFSGVMQNSGFFGGTGGSLTKIGTGTLALTGANTYTGDTNINGGVLKVDGSITSNTFVNPSGTLAGTGTIHGTVASSGGTVSPGDAPGTLTVNGNYTQGNGGVLNIQLASPTLFSRLVITGSATLMPMPRAPIRGAPAVTGANLILDFIDGFAPTTGETFDFFSAAGGVTGKFSNVTIEGLEPGFMFTVSRAGVGGFDLTALNNGVSSGVPDQGATFGLLLVALLGCTLFHWHSTRRRFV